MNIKKRIAKNIICQYHNEQAANEAEAFFTNQFQNKKFEEKNFIPFAVFIVIVTTTLAVVLAIL